MKPTANHRKVFDLHCDTITECHRWEEGLVNDRLHFSLDRIPHTMRLCQAMAVFIPDTLRGDAAVDYYNAVHQTFLAQTARHQLQVCRVERGDEIQPALEEYPAAVVLTVEGGAALGGRLDTLHTLRKQGVRMITLTWNAANELCGGAETDQGFTGFGRRAVELMEALGIAVDVSHLSDRGFWELCEFAQRPFAASHSNARAVCHHRRNLTDDMFREIARRGGVVGLNYYTHFIAREGKTADVGDLIRHAHHFLELGGEDTLALGSDFDGADMPDYLDGVERLEFLWDALERSGIPAAVVEKIFFHNANRYFCALDNEFD